MSTVDQIISDVVDITKEAAYGPTEILRMLNSCLTFVARKMHFSDLEGEDTVDTTVGDNVVALPSDFHYDIFDCRSDSHNQQVKVYDAKRTIDQYLDKLDSGGSVVAVAQSGRNLYYQRRPTSAETIRLYYFKKPTALALQGDIPAYILEDHHDSLFTNWACWKVYARVEDGVEGDKVNTAYYKTEFYQALKEAIIFYKPEPKLQRGFEDFMVEGMY